MAAAFNQIPNSIRTNFVGVEIDDSGAITGPASLAYRGLLIGQKLAGGSAPAGVPVRVGGIDDAGVKFDRSSMLAGQAKKWFQNNQTTEVWALPVDDNAAGNAASASVPFTGTATKSGTIHAYVGDTYVPVACPAGTTATVAAAAYVAELIAKKSALMLPLGTPTAATGTATVPFAHKGEVGNGLVLAFNLELGQEFPAGISATGAQLSGGTTNPALATPIANLGDDWFQIWANAYLDATSLTALETELLSRFSGLRMIDGMMFSSAQKTYSDLTTLGLTRNSAESSIFAQPGPGIATPPWEFAAAAAAQIAFHGQLDPARPFQTLPLIGCKATPTEFQQLGERNLLLYSGISTTRNGAGGIVRIDRPITTYRKNAAGADSVSYLDVTTKLTLMYLRYSWRQMMLTEFPRHKLADDGTRIPPGQFIVTPGQIKIASLKWFDDMADLGLVENPKLFEDNMIVVRNNDRNRVDVVLPPDIMNQLIVVAARLAFRL